MVQGVLKPRVEEMVLERRCVAFVGKLLTIPKNCRTDLFEDTATCSPHDCIWQFV
jgi:hypothetical protein